MMPAATKAQVVNWHNESPYHYRIIRKTEKFQIDFYSPSSTNRATKLLFMIKY